MTFINKLKIIFVFCLCLWLLFPGSLLAKKRITIDSRLNMTILSGIDKVNRGEYEEAMKLFKQVIEQDKESPLGYFYTAAVYEVLMQNYRNRSFNKKFNFYINGAIEKGEQLAKKYQNDELLYFYLGGAYGYRAIDRGEAGNWFGAFVDAVKGAEYLEKAIEINPTLYDAYYGFGVYKYWRSVKSKVLWFLPFFTDERQAGINDIRLAISRGQYAQNEAIVVLAGIYRNEKDYHAALELTETLLAKYPDSIHTLRLKGIILVDLERWTEAAQIFDKLQGQLKNDTWGSPETEMEIEYYITLIHLKQKRIIEYKKGCKRLLELKEKVRRQPHNDTIAQMIKDIDVLCRVPEPEPEGDA